MQKLVADFKRAFETLPPLPSNSGFLLAVQPIQSSVVNHQ